jgi:hypothetical protein
MIDGCRDVVATTTELNTSVIASSRSFTLGADQRVMLVERGAAPAVLPYEAVPGRGRRPDLAKPLGEDGDRAGRDMPIGGRGEHVLDRPDLLGPQSMRGCTRTGGLIIERHAFCCRRQDGTDLVTNAGAAGPLATGGTREPDPWRAGSGASRVRSGGTSIASTTSLMETTTVMTKRYVFERQ